MVNKFKSTMIGGSLSVVTLESTSASFSCDGNATISGNLTISGTTTGITKAMVGLSNVDNVSDTNKPISTATQTALDLKANDNVVVKTSTNQSISGTKSFNATINANGNLRLNGTTSSITYNDGGVEHEITKSELSQLHNTLALDSAVVKLTGSQNVAGNKTFSNSMTVNALCAVDHSRYIRYSRGDIIATSSSQTATPGLLYVYNHGSGTVTFTIPSVTSSFYILLQK